jgi:hypothetical protein
VIPALLLQATGDLGVDVLLFPRDLAQSREQGQLERVVLRVELDLEQSESRGFLNRSSSKLRAWLNV